SATSDGRRQRPETEAASLLESVSSVESAEQAPRSETAIPRKAGAKRSRSTPPVSAGGMPGHVLMETPMTRGEMTSVSTGAWIDERPGDWGVDAPGPARSPTPLMDLSPRPIARVAEDLSLGPEDYVPYGRGKAKLDLALLRRAP